VTQFKQKERVEFTVHDLRHLRVTRAVTKYRQDAKGDPATEAALLEGFQHLMGWRSPETMITYLKTMNKRQALKGLLEDEETQKQSMTHAQVPSQPPPPSPQFTTGQVGESSKPYSHEASDQDELDWYEE